MDSSIEQVEYEPDWTQIEYEADSKPKGRELEEKNLDSIIHELGKHTLLDSMCEPTVAVASLLFIMPTAIAIGNIWYTRGAYFVTYLGVGKLDSMLHNYFEKKYSTL